MHKMKNGRAEIITGLKIPVTPQILCTRSWDAADGCYREVKREMGKKAYSIRGTHSSGSSLNRR